MKDSTENFNSRENKKVIQNNLKNSSYYDNMSFEATSKNSSNTDGSNDIYFTVEEPADVVSQVNGFDTSWMILEGRKYADSSSASASLDVHTSSLQIKNEVETGKCFDCKAYKKLLPYSSIFFMVSVPCTLNFISLYF